jgi:TIGR00730 family protein
MRICVYGASSSNIDEFYIAKTYELGLELAKNGIGMVYGGGMNGLMGAAARGMHDGGAEIIGVAPTFFKVDGVLYENCTELIHTQTMRQRKQIMEEKADGFIVLPGGFGTLDEFFEILTLKQLERHNKPIIIFNIKGYYDNLWEFIEFAITEGFVKEACKELTFMTSSPAELLDYLNQYDPNKVIKTEKLKYIENY